MKRLSLLCFAVLAGCPVEREAAIAVTVSIEAGAVSTHVVVSAVGGEVTRKTRCIPIDGQRFLDVGVAQGDLPATVSLSAVGFRDADCQRPSDPVENAAAIERRFRKGLILDAPLVLRVVRPTIETSCANGLDDDLDGQLDCADIDCTDRNCTTGNACVAGQTCSNGNCQGGQQVTCTAPPSSCFVTGGLCVVDAGCRYLAMPGNTCDDRSDCTTMDRCDGSGSCVGVSRACTQPPAGQCWAPAGVCVADAGCTYQPAVGTRCNDQQNCTIDDRCDADAGCTGTRISCAPRECSVPLGACTTDGGCLYAALDAGLSCGDGGACNVQGACLPAFPFVPSNVAINDIPVPSSGKVTFNCGPTVIDTGASGAPSVTGSCMPTFGYASITQAGGLSTLVMAFEDLEIAGGSTLSIVGVRPAIIVSMKDILVLGAIEVSAGAQPCTGAGVGANGSGAVYKSGGGGGGFASAGGAGGSVTSGAAGGAAGAINLGTQLRGGCPGGLGGGSSARASSGGGALQLVARQTITIAGIINSPGRGGEGGGFGNGGNGGGSGGELLLEAQQVVASSGGLTCNGGGGGEAGTGNAGQAGQLTATPARGGTDGFAGGAGGDGAALGIAADAGEGASFVAGGGGGGGGVGRIRINVSNSCNIGPQVVLSPAATSNRPDAGCP